MVGKYPYKSGPVWLNVVWKSGRFIDFKRRAKKWGHRVSTHSQLVSCRITLAGLMGILWYHISLALSFSGYHKMGKSQPWNPGTLKCPRDESINCDQIQLLAGMVDDGRGSRTNHIVQKQWYANIEICTQCDAHVCNHMVSYIWYMINYIYIHIIW